MDHDDDDDGFVGVAAGGHCQCGRRRLGGGGPGTAARLA